MRKAIFTLSILLASLTLAQNVTITYWQYDFATRIEAMNRLIEQFEAANPDIRVVHETFPYDAYQQRIAAALPAGEGPDVMQLFYGWLPTYVRSGYIEPLPEQYFDSEALDADFVPMVDAAKIDGVYYGLPTAVRSLALFYNRDLFAAQGIEGPPATWDEFIATAQALTERRGSLYSRIGYGIAPGGQDHHLVRTILTRQLGGETYSDDGEVLYGSEAGQEAFRFYTSWVTEHNIGVPDFVPGNNGYRDGFSQQQNIAMIIDGSFAIGSIRNNAQFDWGVAPLPTFDNGVQSNFGSYWLNSLTPNAYRDEARLEASARFLNFVTSEDAMRLWLEVVGELPARQSLLEDEELANDPVFGPFISSLGGAEATVFVDEGEQRSIMINAINRVLLENMSPAASLEQAVQEDQALINELR